MIIVEIAVKKYKIDLDNKILMAPKDIPEFEQVISNCLCSIINTENIRIIVLETWMLIEYFVRQALESAFEMSQYKCDTIDPKYDLLPSSFNACLSILEKLLKEQLKLPKHMEGKESFHMSAKMYFYYKKNHPDFLEKLRKLEEEYNKNVHPKLYSIYKDSDGGLSLPSSIIMKKPQYYQNEKFVNAYGYMNEEWFKNARKINKARNIAAHKYTPEIIFGYLGYDGENEFEQSKNFCLNMIKRLCGVSLCDNIV